MELYSYQISHTNNLYQTLLNHYRAVDSSVTGAGKSVVAVSLAKRLLEEKSITNVLVICPPTLIPQWKEKYLPDWPCLSCHSLYKTKGIALSQTFLVADEFHSYRNVNKRSQDFIHIAKQCKYVLLLSATPYDSVRQLDSSLQSLLPTQFCVLNSRMVFEYTKRISYYYYKVYQTDSEAVLYNEGYKLVRASHQATDDDHNGNVVKQFHPATYSKGYSLICDSLIAGCVRYIQHCVEKRPAEKIIVVLFFKAHFELVLQQFPNALVLNGATSQKNRVQIISDFNNKKDGMKNNIDECIVCYEPTTRLTDCNHPLCVSCQLKLHNSLCPVCKRDLIPERNILCISSDVGGVGIELDDKVGDTPRHMIMLPVTSGISLIQCVGRILRSKTMSDSRVTIIQPKKSRTFFKTYIGRKLEVMSEYTIKPEFQTRVEVHDCELRDFMLPELYLPYPALESIRDYICTCCQ